MAKNGYVFVKKDAGIRSLLKSAEMQGVVDKAARDRYGDAYMRPFIGFDRAKVFVYEKQERAKR